MKCKVEVAFKQNPPPLPPFPFQGTYVKSLTIVLLGAIFFKKVNIKGAYEWERGKEI
jgi:hypothetical protein